MVDIFLEYGYYIVGIGVSMISIIVAAFTGRKYIREWRIEQKNEIKEEISSQVDRVIEKIDQGSAIVNQKFIVTDQAVASSKSDIENINEDIKVLENDFKSLCQTIGKHEYIVDKVFPEYVELKNSIHQFKSKVNENLLTNNHEISRNTEDDKNQK